MEMLKMSTIKMSLAALPLLLIAALPARAHVVLEQQEAEAGSAYKAVFKVGHGCAGSATREISITLPAGLRGARPTPKPGWTLTLRQDRLAQPYESHGRLVSEGVTEVRWTANSEADFLQDAWYDEFVLRASLPEQPGTLWFQVRQRCQQGESNWAERPASGDSIQGLKFPAARLTLTGRKSADTPPAAAQPH
ncbi:MAG: YcnI family protein [Burkholderiaceae bacterium]